MNTEPVTNSNLKCPWATTSGTLQHVSCSENNAALKKHCFLSSLLQKYKHILWSASSLHGCSILHANLLQTLPVIQVKARHEHVTFLKPTELVLQLCLEIRAVIIIPSAGRHRAITPFLIMQQVIIITHFVFHVLFCPSRSWDGRSVCPVPVCNDWVISALRKMKVFHFHTAGKSLVLRGLNTVGWRQVISGLTYSLSFGRQLFH